MKCRSLDLGFVTTLLLVAAVPLIFLRGSPLLDRTECLVSLWAFLSGLVLLWTFLARPSPQEAQATAALSPDGPEGDSRLAWWQTALIAGLLAAFAVVTYFVPMTLQFWGGTDDFISFPQKALLPLMGDWDYWINRPMTALPAFLGQALTPNRVEGYLGLAVGLCWLNGWLLYGILRLLLPQARWLPISAALLFILDRSDPARYYVLWISNVYWMTVTLFLGSLWLFLWSYRRGQRPLLFLSCLLLLGALMMNEGPFPLAVLAPLLAWFLKKQRGSLLLWTYAWVGSMALVAIRFLHFLAHLGTESYQTRETAKAFQAPGELWKNLCTHLEAGLCNFQTTAELVHHRSLVVALLALVGVLVGLAAWRSAPAVGVWRRPQFLLVPGLAAVALLLGSVPYLHIRDVFRTQFLTAPGQAVLLACVLCGVASLLGRRAGTVAVAAALGLLAANTTAEATRSQQQLRAQSPINFERTVHIFRQIRTIYPNPTPDSLILLYLDEPYFAPFANNYCCLNLSRNLLGTPVIPVNFASPDNLLPEFGPHAVFVQNGEKCSCSGNKAYDKILAFRLAQDGTVTFLRQLPNRRLPPNHTANRYNPLAHLRPGPVKELPYLRFPFWARRPTDLFDMTDGVLLGQGWGPLQVWEGKLSRQGGDAAELVVNPLGQQQRQLCFRMEPVSSGCLEALDLEDRVVATADLKGRQEVTLTVPTDPNRFCLIRLRVTRGHGPVGSFRVFCPGTKMADFQKPPTPPREIVTDALALGKNWHLLEFHDGQSFRWVANDAEIILPDPLPTPKTLLLDLMPGPGVGYQPFQLTVLDETGKTVATAWVQDGEVVRLRTLANSPAGAILRLHVEGGGQSHPKDRRIMNFKVYGCALEAD